MRKFFFVLSLHLFFLASTALSAGPSCAQLFEASTAQQQRRWNHDENVARLSQAIESQNNGDQVVKVVLNSLTYDVKGIRAIQGVEHYVSRYLGPVVLEALLNPNVSYIYPTIFTIADSEVLHYAEPVLQLMSRQDPGFNLSEARQNLLDRIQRPQVTRSEGWLGEQILADSDYQAQLMESLEGRTAYAELYYATDSDSFLLNGLGLPVYGNPTATMSLGSKSGNKDVFERAGVPMARGKGYLTNRRQFAEEVYRLLSSYGVSEFMVKLDEGASGLGNARFDLSPDTLAFIEQRRQEAQGQTAGGVFDIYLGAFAQTQADIVSRIEEDLYNQLRPANPEATSRSFWDEEFAYQGQGIVEEFRSGVVSSPSGQGRVNISVDSRGRVEVVSTHEQILAGQVFQGSVFPADESYRTELESYTARVAEVLAEDGFIGDFGVDFLLFEDGSLMAVEINMRRGGTSHPQFQRQVLQQFDPSLNLVYRSTDTHKSDRLRDYDSVDDFLASEEVQSVLFDFERGEGVFFHFAGAIADGKVGYTAHAATPERAQEIFDHVADLFPKPETPVEQEE